MTNEEINPTIVADGVVVTLDYTLAVDDEVVDSSEGGEPIQFIQGQGNIVRGLERQLYGMAIGEKNKVVVSPADGYGEVQEERMMDYPRGEFPTEIPLKIGADLRLRNQDGEIFNARIASINDETVSLDFNHPLAGKELHFNVKVTDLREATEEEKRHGHVHSGHEH